MSKKTSSPAQRGRGKKPFQDSVSETDSSTTTTPSQNSGNRWYLIAVFAVIALGGTYLMNAMKNAPHDVPRFTYEVIKEHPHDPDAFTQGLLLEDGIVFESTGKYDGKSSVRKYKLGSTEMDKLVPLPNDEFGEGLAMVDEKLFQITWKEEVCHVYDKELNKIKDFKYRGHGWGLAYDGKHLIMSNGSSSLYFIDPETFEDVRKVAVRNGRRPINDLNELEYSGGSIYANRLNHDNIYEINPTTGQIESIIELSGLWEDRPREGVLNGIAVDSKTGRIIVTGKYCPKIFEIKLLPKNIK